LCLSRAYLKLPTPTLKFYELFKIIQIRVLEVRKEYNNLTITL